LTPLAPMPSRKQRWKSAKRRCPEHVLAEHIQPAFRGVDPTPAVASDCYAAARFVGLRGMSSQPVATSHCASAPPTREGDSPTVGDLSRRRVDSGGRGTPTTEGGRHRVPRGVHLSIPGLLRRDPLRAGWQLGAGDSQRDRADQRRRW
jgi:hypothetical protein